MKTRLLVKAMLTIFVILPSFLMSQTVPTQSAPVNGSTWETTSPVLYWWYLPNPYSLGPFNYNVQVSTDPMNFNGTALIVNSVVTTSTTGSFQIPSSAGISVGHTYYWRVGLSGNYSTIWSFSPGNWGGGGGGSGGPVYYTISSTAGAHGSISPTGSVSVAETTDQTFTITPDAGYEINDVQVDNVSVGLVSNYTFTNVTASHSIEATFNLVPQITYVAVTGDDLNGDGTQSNPYRTIQRGLNKTDPAGTVFVSNGNYEEDLVITKPVTLLGETNPATSSVIIRANNITIKNLNVHARPGSGPGPGIQKVGLAVYDHLDYLTLENVQVFNNNEQGLLLENINHVVIKNSRFYDNQMAGIGLAFCNDVSMEDVGMEGNLRGLWAHSSSDIVMKRVYLQDNGKFYPANYPDQNGFTFTETENITITDTYSNRNEEQGFKFEDCSNINLNNVSASNNRTDGMAFINCTEINYDTGFANDNGENSGDNGAEFVKCTNFTLSNFAANNNYSMGIYLGTRYTGQYQWDSSNPANSLRNNYFVGMSSNVAFQSITGDNNGTDGLMVVHTNTSTFKSLNFTHNGDAGLFLDASHHLTFTDGVFDNNNNGIYITPKDHNHPLSHNIAQDEITLMQFLGTVSASNNLTNGITLTTAIDVNPGAPAIAQQNPKIVEPFFNGKFTLLDNGTSAIKIEGKVLKPSFYGMYLKSGSVTNSGLSIYSNATDSPNNVLINNSIFEGFSSSNFAINLVNSAPGSIADKNVDAKNNVFVGATTSVDVDNVIHDKNDDGALGLVDYTGWSSGTPIFKIGSASAYTGALVTVPVTLSDPVGLLSPFSKLEGVFNFNDLNINFKYATYGTGTLIHDAGWVILFDHTVSDKLSFQAIGGSSQITANGILFYLTFEVTDAADGAETVSANTSSILADNVGSVFDVHNGTINYTANSGISLIRGDATLDFTVDLGDYIAIINHINGNLLTGQGLINADVNSDGIVNALDASDILSFINHNVWPNTPSASSSGSLIFTTATVNQNGLMRFPLTVTNGKNIRTLEVNLNYDDSKVDFRTFTQLMSGTKYHVDAKEISKGNARLIFSAADETQGFIVPAEIAFNIKGNPNSSINIISVYSINGGNNKTGPVYYSDGITGVENKNTLPTKFSVSQNYPNPFNPTTVIDYSIPAAGFVSIKVYDILGRLVNTIVNEQLNAGFYKTVWNGVDNSGRRVASGIYFYRVKNGSNLVTKKMVLLK